MGKNEICWVIFSGKIMLPSTLRSTKNQCIDDRINELAIYYGPTSEDGLRSHETCRKMIINEWVKP